MSTLREDIADIQQRLDDAEHATARLSHRQNYLLLVTSFLQGLLELPLELVEKVERQLVGSGPPSSCDTSSARHD